MTDNIVQQHINLITQNCDLLKAQLSRIDATLKEFEYLMEKSKIDYMSEENSNAVSQIMEKYKEQSGVLIADFKQYTNLTFKSDHTRTMHRNMVHYLRTNIERRHSSFLNIQQNYKSHKKTNMKRLVAVVNNDAIDQSADPKEIMMMAMKNTQLANALNYINEKHNEILALEQSIVELRQLFLDMAIMTETQQTTLDNIESSTMSAVINVDCGNAQLLVADGYQKSSRKKMCCIIICIMIVIAVLSLSLKFALS
jgi:t-SNARE complex subunit (syntaxin)